MTEEHFLHLVQRNLVNAEILARLPRLEAAAP